MNAVRHSALPCSGCEQLGGSVQLSSTGVLQAPASPATLAGSQGCLLSARGGGGPRYSTLVLPEPFCSALLACRGRNEGEFWCATLRATELRAGLRQALPPHLIVGKKIMKAICCWFFFLLVCLFVCLFCVGWFLLSLEPTCPEFLLILFLLYFTFFALMLFPQMQT